MSNIIKFAKKSPYLPASEGIHDAVVVDVVATEGNDGTFNKVRIVWEVAATLPTGRRFTVTKPYYCFDRFIADFEPVLGSNHPLITGEEENVNTIVGMAMRVDVVHNRTNDGGVFPHVNALFPAGKVVLLVSPHYVRLAERNRNREEVPNVAAA